MPFTDVTRRGSRSRNPVELPPHISHGTPTAYRKYGCRCAPCRGGVVQRYVGTVTLAPSGRRLWIERWVKA